MKNSDLCCRQLVHADFATATAATVAAATADSWDSAMSNSPVEDDFGGPAGGIDWGLGGGGGGCSLGCGISDLGSLGGGGRYAEITVSDEGFLEGAGRGPFWANKFDECDCDDDDDLESTASSNGSEILQMVDQLLQAFNLEVQAASVEPAAATAAASGSADVFELVSASALATGFRVPNIDEEEIPDPVGDQDDISELQTDDDEAYWEAGREDEQPVMYFFKDADSLDGDEADSEASSTASSASLKSPQPSPPPPPFLADGLFRLPEETVLEAMDYWGPLDRIRWLLWRPEPCPPKSEVQQQQQQPPKPQQQPLDKSKRACSFLLKGRCRKEDCEFAHDLSKVTCKFWATGQCFKGAACPFLHGYAD